MYLARSEQVMGVRIRKEDVRASKPTDVDRVLGEIRRLAIEKFDADGHPDRALRLLEEELANSTRKAYATAIAQEFR